MSRDNLIAAAFGKFHQRKDGTITSSIYRPPSAATLRIIQILSASMSTIDRYAYLNQKQEAEEYSRSLAILNDEYVRVCSEGIRIEQEQLPLDEILNLVPVG